MPYWIIEEDWRILSLKHWIVNRVVRWLFRLNLHWNCLNHLTWLFYTMVLGRVHMIFPSYSNSPKTLRLTIQLILVDHFICSLLILVQKFWYRFFFLLVWFSLLGLIQSSLVWSIYYFPLFFIIYYHVARANSLNPKIAPHQFVI